MATAPAPRKRPTPSEAPKSLVAQAAGTDTTPTTDTQWRHWNVRLPADLVERIWGTCEALDNAEDLPSAVAFTVRAFEEMLDRLDAEHNNGKPYHATTSPFRSGGRTTYKR